jgi:hypothetical protein
MTVSGNVQVTNTPNVAIVNNSANPVLVQQAGMPYSADKVGTCNGTNCFIDFPEVPAGKQLVIVYLSAVARPTAQTTIFDFAELEASDTAEPQFATRYTFPMARIGQAGASVIADTYGVNTPLLAFVNAGQIPHLTLAQRTNGEVFFSQATISGYLVSVTQ